MSEVLLRAKPMPETFLRIDADDFAARVEERTAAVVGSDERLIGEPSRFTYGTASD
jgi:hypothetical protein